MPNARQTRRNHGPAIVLTGDDLGQVFRRPATRKAITGRRSAVLAPVHGRGQRDPKWPMRPEQPWFRSPETRPERRNLLPKGALMLSLERIENTIHEVRPGHGVAVVEQRDPAIGTTR